MFLDNAAFLTQLTRLFEKSKTQGTVFITMKRHSHDVDKQRRKERKANGKDKVMSDGAAPAEESGKDEDDATEFPCLIRAVGGKSKLSTLIKPLDETRFLEEYGRIIRVHMDTLKKKDRKKQRRELKESKAKKAKTVKSSTTPAQ